MLKSFISASVLVVLVLSLASGANALTSDRRTYFTFTRPVALPGVTLPPGTYMFRVANEMTSANIVQVASKQGDRSYAMIATTPAYRDDPQGEPGLQFMETPTGAPLAVKAWWSSGESVGYEFIYPEDQRDAARRSVLAQPPPSATDEEAPGAASEARPTRPAIPSLEELEGSPDVIEGAGVPPRPESRSQAAQAQEPGPQSQQQSAGQARQELPRTASPVPLVLLSGVVASLVGLRLLRKS